MPSAPFQPGRIFVDRDVRDLPLTLRILAKYPATPVEILETATALKKPTPMTGAKKNLVLARLKADPLKEFSAMTESADRPYYSLDLISNCHLECTYCILQSYLENNPAITIYTNLEEILERLALQIAHLQDGSIVGTGKIADSLALDDVSEHTKSLVPFFARQHRVTLELKTKSDRIDHLIDLNHGDRTVVSWSMNPQTIIEREEYKTASFEERLTAAQRVGAAGYRVGFHFDPVIAHDGWRENYQTALGQIFEAIPAEKIAWVSVGSLRFPARQARIMRQRFPRNNRVLDQMISTHRTFLHYSGDLREQIHGFFEDFLRPRLHPGQYYRCMDF